MKKQILIVEDDPAILSVLMELLTEEGYQAIGAANGQIALDILEKASPLPNLILLDLMMPVLSGAQFREEQMKRPRISSIPVVLMTADANIEKNKVMISAQHYLRKPLDIDVLINVVKQYSKESSP